MRGPVKGWRKFTCSLGRAADGDSHASMMFFDNYNRNGKESEQWVNYFVKKGNFKWAIALAFSWHDTPEKADFWEKMFSDIKNDD